MPQVVLKVYEYRKKNNNFLYYVRKYIEILKDDIVILTFEYLWSCIKKHFRDEFKVESKQQILTLKLIWTLYIIGTFYTNKFIINVFNGAFTFLNW